MTEKAQGYEKRDIHAGTVAAFLAGLIVLFIFTYATSDWMIHLFRPAGARPGLSPSAEIRARPLPPEPRLQVDPARDLAGLRAQEDSLLNGAGWVDEKTGIAHIPIDQAMSLLERRGLPARKGNEK